MARYNWRQVMLDETSMFGGKNESISHNNIWDPVNAKFRPHFLPYLSAIPLLVAVCIVLSHFLFPLYKRRPIWARNFVKELPEPEGEIILDLKKHHAHTTLFLLLASTAGLLPSVVSLFFIDLELSAASFTASWVLAILIVAIHRPKTASVSLLALYTSMLVSHLLILASKGSSLRLHITSATVELLAASGAIVITVLMPMRNPELPDQQISHVFEPPTDELRSPEDNLTLWQFMTVSWMYPLINLGKTRQLNNDDVWSLGYEFHHRKLHHAFRELRGSVVIRLLKANGIDLIIITLLSIIGLVTAFATPVLLQQLLRSMEDVRAPRHATVVYAILSLVVRLVRSQADVFNLWFSRRCYERSRGEMITMIYEKTLTRKMIGIRLNPHGGENNEETVDGREMHTELPRSYPKVLWNKLCSVPLRLKGGSMKQRPSPEETKQPASMGKILNLMRFDVYEVAQRFWDFEKLITRPLGLIISVVLIWNLIGWSCLAGVLTILVGQALNALVVRVLLRKRRLLRKITDGKLQITTQFVEAIRHLRWYSWQNAWLERIMEKRQQELSLLVVTNLWGLLISFTNTLATGMFPVIAFSAYTVWAGFPLTIDIAFPALQLFNYLDMDLREIPELITVLLNASIAVGRIEDFMSEPDKPNDDPQTSNCEFELQNASFAWPGSAQAVLLNVTLTFPIGLTVIRGKVGAGKSALLLALLGELDLLNGKLTRTNELIGFCEQSPWLQSMSIRENILFHSPFEITRYKQVLEACALTTDLASFKDGDSSNIGENGIGLSGGQKARVALARAIYSRAKILMLDDPLSALDHQTADTIVRKCLGGPLVKNRVVVLVTHRHELCLHLAKQVIEISDFGAHVVGDGNLGSDPTFHDSTRSVTDSGYQPSEGGKGPDEVPDKFMEDEFRAHGGVNASVYWEYIKAGKLKWWFVLICVQVAFRLASVARTWFLKSWGEAYHRTWLASITDLFDKMPSPEVNVRPWLIGFFLLAFTRALMELIVQGVMIVIVYCAGRQMFRQIMVRVSYATFRFYDVTPVGRLMNRLTSDISTIDGNISRQFSSVASYSISWISAVVVIASVTPVFLVFSLALTAGFVYIFLKFLPTSQSLRRLEMVSLTPLMSNFGALLNGLTTVRAFCAQSNFQDRVIAVTDDFQKMDHFYWSLQSWLMYRFDNLAACSTFLLTLLALYTGVTPGLTAFVLDSAHHFVNSTHAVCRYYGQLQMDFVSVERIVEILHLEQEPKGAVEPPAAWPTFKGDVIFENVTIRYAPHLDPSLSNISFKIKGGSTTAILGRTGSGKSTLVLALLATILPDSGRILIDGIDISTVNKEALRSRVTFLAQDPVLFPGSMRQNLDPLNEHSDHDCEIVLLKVCGSHRWTLDMQIDTGGRNLSQGQRQLVGLARAILRRSPIIILDEATASIDMETAMRIQQVLRDEMSESTVITIAHRLEAVRNADGFVRLRNGEVVEMGGGEGVGTWE